MLTSRSRIGTNAARHFDLAVQIYRAKRICIEPRSGGNPVAPGVSPGIGVVLMSRPGKGRQIAVSVAPPALVRVLVRKPRAYARGYGMAAAPRLNNAIVVANSHSSRYDAGYPKVFLL